MNAKYFFLCLIFTSVVISATVPTHAASSSSSSSSSRAQANLDKLRSNMMTPLLTPSSSLLSNAEKYFSSFNQTTSKWKDVGYVEEGWSGDQHLSRAAIIAQAALVYKDDKARSLKYLGVAKQATEWWLINDPRVSNWWNNQIATPEPLGKLCNLLGDRLNTTQREKLRSILRRANWTRWTGANVLWQTSVAMWEGICFNNYTLVAEAFKASWNELHVSSDVDGIKIDGTFFQHKLQVYNGGYGAVFLEDVLDFIQRSMNITDLMMPNNRRDLIASMVLDGFQWMTVPWIPSWDISVKGREITRPGSWKKYSSAMTSPVLLQLGTRTDEFKQMQSRIGNPSAVNMRGNKMFWVSDYMTHHRPKYMTTVRMYSQRTKSSECVNLEGKKSGKYSDGNNFLYLTGKEYAEIFHTWNWDHVPGITSEVNSIQLACNATGAIGLTTFVGGVSDGEYGVAAFDFAAPYGQSLRAKKSWFFFDDEYLALGSGISTSSNKLVDTVVDQKHSNGPVYVSSDATKPFTGQSTLKGLDWVWHSNVGYIFPDKTRSVTVFNQNQSGKWSDIRPVKNDSPLTASIFSMWISSTKVPAHDDSYEYLVVPAVDLNGFKSKKDAIQSSVQVLQNTPTMQSVYHSVLKIWSVVFYSASAAASGTGAFAGLNVHASAPCVVMMRLDSKTNGIQMTLSDPTQKLTSVSLDLNQRYSCTQCTDKTTTTGTSIKVTLPSGLSVGQSVKLSLMKKSTTSVTKKVR